jgi:tRNA A64-2'-O-ribosylphosphate transferase
METAEQLTFVGPGKQVAITTIAAVETCAARANDGNSDDNKDNDIIITVAQKESSVLRTRFKSKYLHLSLAQGKIGSRNLRHSLPALITHLKVLLSCLSATTIQPPRIIVADANAKDLGVGVALAILCLFITDNGMLKSSEKVTEPPVDGLNKQAIKYKLSWISIAKPDANPSRATLQSVNAYLLG